MAQNGLGVALRSLRERRTLSLREMGQLSTVDHAYVHRLETGEKASPTQELVAKLLKVLKPTERDTELVRWLVDHPDADAGLVEYVLADQSIELEVFSAAAGIRHRGTARPDPATLIGRIRRAFADEDDE
jgi:transcriptional regulator with XRE-family HTH domain